MSVAADEEALELAEEDSAVSLFSLGKSFSVLLNTKTSRSLYLPFELS